MRAIGTDTHQFETLKPVDVPEPEPGPNDVRIVVHASSVNPADILVVRSEGAAFVLHAKTKPQVPGYDFSGVVDAVGSRVRSMSVGDAVFGHLAYARKTKQGAFAEKITIDQDAVAKKTDELSHDNAGVLATVGLTALQALRDHGGAKSGDRVLIIGASGGVGSFAVLVAKQLGVHVTAICSTYAVDYVRRLGADVIVDRKKVDPMTHDEPFDIIFDTTGSYSVPACAKLLSGSGRFVTTLPSASFALGKLVTLFSSKRLAFLTVQSKQRDLELLAQWVGEGMSIPIAMTYTAQEAGAALQKLRDGGVLGKIAIDVRSI